MPIAFAHNETHADHRTDRHVERPERLDSILRLLDEVPVRRHVRTVDFDRAGLDLLALVHAERHVAEVVEAVQMGYDRLDADTYLTAGSLNAALDAVGALIEVTNTVVHGGAKSGFAAIRPPGHHATPNRSMGFCLFSNVAVAARWAQHEAGVGRVLVVDYDVHHGNGTQDVFYDDPSVTYMSVHQSPFYPGTGAAHERGADEAVGTTINVPLPASADDEAYLRVFRNVFRPLALRFDPELIMLSAGYDAHWKDPLGGMRVTVHGFAALVREISSWADACCDGRLVAALEGGYDLDALARSVVATLDVLHDPEAGVEDPLGEPPGNPPNLDDYLEEIEAIFS